MNQIVNQVRSFERDAGNVLRVPSGPYATANVFHKRQVLEAFARHNAFLKSIRECLDLIEANREVRREARLQIDGLQKAQEIYHAALTQTLESKSPCESEDLVKKEACFKEQVSLCALSMANKLRHWVASQTKLTESERLRVEQIAKNFERCAAPSSAQQYPLLADRQETRASVAPTGVCDPFRWVGRAPANRS